MEKILSGERPSLEKLLMANHYSHVDLNALTDLQKQNIRFALSTNQRGLSTIKRLEDQGICFKNANVLDVGCAYGGFTIEARRRGASIAYGIDIMQHLILLANANLSDEDEEIAKGIEFALCDMTSIQALCALPNNFFNIIIVNDVFEHVYDTCRLLSVISKLASQQCTLYFEIPNGLHFIDFVEREPHSHKYGLSILDPNRWHEMGWFETYYRRWDYFAALFSHYGFNEILLDPHMDQISDITKLQLLHDLYVRLENVESSLRDKFPNNLSSLAASVMSQFEKYKLEINNDIDEMDVSALSFKYLTPFWRGVAIRNANQVSINFQHVELKAIKEQYRILRQKYETLAKSKLGRLQICIWERRTSPYNIVP